ncbi:hypothetical protein PLICRDRAFT_319083 [Plicaturopsis crispa FD-325 SS-3]|nr:hypothetical protein PLICRDRAFT_319083 [Plicaturopsis crispa FD-325 SS-3]
MPARNSSTPTDQGSASRGHFFASDTRSHTRVRGSGYSNEEDEHRTPMSTFPTSHSSSMTVPRARSHHSAEVGASARSDPPQSDQGQGTLSTRQRRQSAGGSSIASSEDGYASSHASRDRSSRTDRHVRWHEPPPVISEPSGTGHHRGNRVHSYDQAGSAPDSQRSRSSRPRNPSSASLPEPPRPPAEVPERISSVAANHSDDDPGYTVFPHMSTHHPRRRSSSNASTHSTTLRQPVSFSSSSQPSEWVYSHQVGTWVSAITGQTADGRAVSTRSNLAASSTTANAQSGRTSNAHSAPMLPRSWSTRS